MNPPQPTLFQAQSSPALSIFILFQDASDLAQLFPHSPEAPFMSQASEPTSSW